MLARNKSGGSKIRTSIYCHLCKVNFPTQEDLRMHIMRKHRPSSKYYEGDSEDSERVDFAENSQGGAKCKLENNTDDEDSEDFDNQNLYNISETAVSPQSLSHQKNKKHSPNRKFNISKVKEECEEVGNSSAQFNSSATDMIDFNNISSSASQIAPQIISFANNQINSQFNPMLNNPQIILNNNQLQLVNPYNQQSNYLVGNQPALQFNPPVVINPLPSQKIFEFNAKNIISWFNKFKKMSKTMNYPLKRKVLKQMKSVQQELFQNCSFPHVFVDEEKQALLKIYQDIALILCKHNEIIQDM